MMQPTSGDSRPLAVLPQQLLLLLPMLLLLAAAPAAAVNEDQEWWRREIVYQIYPRSFKDSDGDGTGDIRGIMEKLDYVKDIGANAIWLSPVYRSPMADFGYDISNHTDIDPIFGTMADFDLLLKEIHKRDMYIIMDFVPNHTSDQHPWFQSSRSDRGGRHADYYVWTDCQPPPHSGDRPVGVNNWLSYFGGPAWTYDAVRGQCYLHQFTPQQPDLNYSNPAVRHDMTEVVRFWMRKGVDGLRVDAIRHLFEDPLLRDEPPATGSLKVTDNPLDHDYLDHIYTAGYNETYEVMQEWYRILDGAGGRRRLMVAEAYSPLPELMQYYEHKGEKVADYPFNFELLLASRHPQNFCNSRCLHAAVTRFLEHVPPARCPNWVLGNHDNKRMASRFLPAGTFQRALNTLLLTLPGAVTCYYGDELGMTDIPLKPEEVVDPWGRMFFEHSRDPARAPMLWDSSANSGFTAADSRPWLPVQLDFADSNAMAQSRSRSSVLSAFKHLAVLRRSAEFRDGGLRFLLADDELMVYLRGREDSGYIVALYISESSRQLQVDLRLRCSSVSVAADLRAGSSRPGGDGDIDAGSVAMAPGDAVILRVRGCESLQQPRSSVRHSEL